MPLEVAAVTVPFRMNAGSSFARDSGVSPARGVSSAANNRSRRGTRRLHRRDLIPESAGCRSRQRSPLTLEREFLLLPSRDSVRLGHAFGSLS